ncbi:MAG: proton extrusion protein PcxA [Microcoleaceae cyanobacterium]
MIIATWTPVRRLWRRTNRWFRETPERALDQAYSAALRVKALENEHFKGQKIGQDSTLYSYQVNSYFKSELRKNLNIIQMRLKLFNIGRSMLGISESVNLIDLNGRTHFGDTNHFKPEELNPSQIDPNQLRPSNQTVVICEKLDLIDSVLARYSASDSLLASDLNGSSSNDLVSSSNIEAENIRKGSVKNRSGIDLYKKQSIADLQKNIDSSDRCNTSADNGNESRRLEDELSRTPKTSFLPRSLLSTFGRIRRELNPESDAEVLKDYRKSKLKTVISIRFILLLILVPLLTQQLAKNFIVSPIVNHFVDKDSAPVFLNLDMEEHAFNELNRYKEHLEFQQMIGMAPKLNEAEMEEALEEKATEIAAEYTGMGTSAIENVFADLISVAVFGVIVYTNKQEVEILKSFLGDVIYGLSDSAKAFIIILLTDMFVGFHSPHGWEVILESISRHFGLPESRDFNFLFIATFPVILDAVFKYWIFRYLNRSSPSAVSTYKTMNE